MSGGAALQALKYLLFASSAGLIQILTFTLFLERFRWPHWVAYLVSLVLSVLWNFTFNRKFTFKSSANVPVAMAKVALYYLIFTPLSTWWSNAITQGFPATQLDNYLVEGGTMLVNCVTEFLFYRFVVYRHSMNTAVRQDESVLPVKPTDDAAEEVDKEVGKDSEKDAEDPTEF
jgi:putative flippase GtrA